MLMTVFNWQSTNLFYINLFIYLIECGTCTYHHISISYSFHLVYVVIFYDGVETSVQIIQKIYNLQIIIFL